MKAAHHIFEYLTAFAVVVLFSAVILFFPAMGAGKVPAEVSAIDVPGALEQPAASATPQTKVDAQKQG